MSGSFQRGLRPKVPDFLPLPTQLHILEAQLMEIHMIQNVVHISSFQNLYMSTNLFSSMMLRGIQADGWHYTVLIVYFPKKISTAGPSSILLLIVALILYIFPCALYSLLPTLLSFPFHFSASYILGAV